MIILTIGAAVAAAQPAPAPAPDAAHAQHSAMASMAPAPAGKPAAKEECCCKDKMAKKHEGQGAEHKDHSGR